MPACRKITEQVFKLTPKIAYKGMTKTMYRMCVTVNVSKIESR